MARFIIQRGVVFTEILIIKNWSKRDNEMLSLFVVFLSFVVIKYTVETAIDSWNEEH
jgi:hypothetical protein